MILNVRKSKYTHFMALGTAVVLVVIDQIVKFLVSNNIELSTSKQLIPGFLKLTYIQNTGAAFGMFQGQRVILSIVTFVALAIFTYILASGKLKRNFLIWSSALIIAGGLGNLIDRVFRGYVIDYLDIGELFRFPIFNFADCCVVVGSIMLMIFLIFLSGATPKGESDDKNDKINSLENEK